MSAPLSCEPRCCPTTTTIGSPGAPGAAGADGADGSDGLNAFTITTADFVVPAIGANVTVSVDDSSWASIGQIVFVEDAGFFEVISKPSSTSIVIEYLDYNGNTHATDNITTGAQMSPAGTEPDVSMFVESTDPLSVFAAGTAEEFTDTPALLDFGTTDPELDITSAGTWLIHYYCRVDYTGTTYAGNQTVTIKLRRTNNTAADLTNSTREALMDSVTTTTATAYILSGTIPYVTANADDHIQMWGSVSATPAAGSVDAVEAAIVCQRIHQ